MSEHDPSDRSFVGSRRYRRDTIEGFVISTIQHDALYAEAAGASVVYETMIFAPAGDAIERWSDGVQTTSQAAADVAHEQACAAVRQQLRRPLN